MLVLWQFVITKDEEKFMYLRFQCLCKTLGFNFKFCNSKTGLVVPTNPEVIIEFCVKIGGDAFEKRNLLPHKQRCDVIAKPSLKQAKIQLDPGKDER